MAREHARLRQSLWADDEFKALTGEAQHIYMLGLSQPGLSYAGVVSFTPTRWAGLYANGTVRKVRKAVDDLTDAHFVHLSAGTEELLFRTFIKNDGLLSSPNICIAVVSAYKSIIAASLRQVFLIELHRLYEETHNDPKMTKGWDNLSPLLTETFPEGLPESGARSPSLPFSLPITSPGVRHCDVHALQEPCISCAADRKARAS